MQPKSIASHNGLRAAERAYQLLLAKAAPLDACVEGVTLIEDDPTELTVGFGGLPNEDGVVELDAAVMDGPTHRGAGVAGLRNVRHPSKVARCLLRQTNRVLLVGEGALEFARVNGFPEENLLTDQALQMWRYWKRKRSHVDDWLDPSPEDAHLDVQHWYERHFYGGTHQPPNVMPQGGTVHCSGLDLNGDLACVTSTSGHAFKIAGRVGDSPILGAGLYVDNDVGTCGSIGHGEANLQNLSSFLGVELMRGGASPLEAGLEMLRRVVKHAHPSQRDAQGRPTYNLQFFLMAKDGRHAGVALWGPKQIAVCDEHGPRLEPCHALYEHASS